MTKKHKTTTEMAQAAPFDVDSYVRNIVGLQARAVKHDRFRTLLYCRSGLRLIELKKAFKQLGRRDYCEYTELQGIEPWFRKRATQIARHFKSEEACKGIPLLEALKIAKTRPDDNPRQANAKPSQNGQLRHAARTGTGNSATEHSTDSANAAAESDYVTANLPGGQTSPLDTSVNQNGQHRAEHGESTVVRQEEIDAAAAFIEAVGDWRRAVQVLLSRGSKEQVRPALAGMLTAMHSAVEWAEINEAIIALKSAENGIEATTV